MKIYRDTTRDIEEGVYDEGEPPAPAIGNPSGVTCPQCQGIGHISTDRGFVACPACAGRGKFGGTDDDDAGDTEVVAALPSPT